MSHQGIEKERSRGISRDMSPAAIAKRLEIVSELRVLTQLLGHAKRVGEEKPEDSGRTGNRQ